MSLRVLVLSRYSQLGASSRLRMFQYVDSFCELGLTVSISALFEDDYLRTLYRSNNLLLNRLHNFKGILKSYITRLSKVISREYYDVVWVEKELFPFLPSFFESLLAKRNIPYIVDYDDAIFHNYDLHRSKVVRLCLGNKLRPLLQQSSAVTAGNAYLAAYAKKHGAANTFIIPTVVDLSKYSVVPESDDVVFRIGWIGSPSTAKYLSLIQAPLVQLAKLRKIKLVTIGAPVLNFAGVDIEQHDWTADTEAKLLQTIHVGVMPLEDSPWERGKCGYKLIQYMACGRPVIASPVGVNTEIVDANVGLLASGDNAWFEALNGLAENRFLRQQMGLSARTCVEQRYSVQVTVPLLVNIFKQVLR